MGEDIKCGGGNVALLESVCQSGFVHKLPPRAVHQAYAFLRLLQGIGIDHAFSLGREAHVQGELVRGGVNVFELRQADALLFGDYRRYKWIVRDNFQSETTSTAGNLHADASKPDNSESLTAKLGSSQRFFLPFAGVRQ